MWNPEQYLKFAQSGFRPALDLLARIVFDSPWTVYGLGCGTGNSWCCVKNSGLSPMLFT
jgi:trans-aconitate methyltransferase